MSTLQANEVVTGECRLSYVNLMTPKAITQGGTPNYSVKILIPKSDQATLNALTKARDVARQNGVTEGKKPFAQFSAVKLATMSVALKDGDTAFPDNPECAGCWVLNAKTPEDKPPGVLNEKRERVTNHTEIYSGMYGRVHIQLFPYDTAGNAGIGVSLQNVMKTKDGEPLGGARKKAEDVFGAPESPFADPVSPLG
jgi:hypothetical protein